MKFLLKYAKKKAGNYQIMDWVFLRNRLDNDFRFFSQNLPTHIANSFFEAEVGRKKYD